MTNGVRRRDPVAFPPDLAKYEEALLARRRPPDTPVDTPLDDAVGVALSGGGIRSATFCLGVFQALARLRLLNRVDYLSTVSGGGYFGAFLGRLFTRAEVRDVGQVEEELLAGLDSPNGEQRTGAFQWLRKNGRYLSPRGSGDLLLGLSVLMRNWVAVQVVLITLVLMVFLAAQLLRMGLELGLPDLMRAVQVQIDCLLPGSGSVLWWSPYAALVAACVLLWVVPAGWAYWMLVGVGLNRVAEPRLHPVFGLLATLVLTAAGLWLLPADRELLRAACGIVLLATIVTGLTAAVVYGWCCWWAARAANVDCDESARHCVSVWLKSGLIATALLAVFALVDSLGQTIFAVLIRPDSSIGAWSAAIFGGLLGLAASARQFAVIFGSGVGGKRLRLPTDILLTGAAVLIVGLALTVASVGSHAIAWNFRVPVESPAAIGKSTSVQTPAPRVIVLNCARGAVVGARESVADLQAPALGWAIAALLSLLFGRSWPFLQFSSHHPLYSARLTRSYLGASNPLRREPAHQAVTQVMPGDDIELCDYWPPVDHPGPCNPFAKGAPIHLINVTINETIDGRSGVQQQDRKGLGLALGPGGMSAGVRHHVVFKPDCGRRSDLPPVETYPDAGERVPSQVFRIFAYRDEKYSGEMLSLGRWAAISGAAFSTGLGARTSLGLSLLAGFGNVRLGHWWISGIVPQLRAASSYQKRRASYLLTALKEAFKVQTFFMYEFLARFHGPFSRYWYLSDGGHFENMGAYELIRRRLPVIVVIDAEADEHYTFEGLANLVRKARLDFQAEITFLTAEELDDVIDPGLRRFFGPLEHLRRGRWDEEPMTDPNDPDSKRTRKSIENTETHRRSLAHAALARVRYDGGTGPESWLLYIKPTLIGGEPADVAQYHAGHPAFPQETTADQFFDEAQWESYRKLGDHIGTTLFKPIAPGEPGRFVPNLFGLRR